MYHESNTYKRDDEIADREIKALLAYLNSGIVTDGVSSYGRSLQEGLDKYSKPKELEELPTIDPRTLSADIVDELAEQFDALCEAQRSGGNISAATDTIDRILEAKLVD